MVIEFAQCIARPDEGEFTFPLIAHLEAVAAQLGSNEGSLDARLSYLAGIMHDIGKANTKWQAYIRDTEKQKGPPHAVYGSVLYCYYAEAMLSTFADSRKLSRKERRYAIGQILRWARDIYDHHIRLNNIEEERTPWQTMPPDWEYFDLDGIHLFVSGHFPELEEKTLSTEVIITWEKSFRQTWRRWYLDWASSSVRGRDLAPGEGVLRVNTAAFIQADRIDAARLQQRMFTREEIEGGREKLLDYLQKKKEESDARINPLRQQVHEEALDIYRANRHKRSFVLKLPTGMGKTMTALRLALEMAYDHEKRRIVYVAPYLSILHQAAHEIYSSTGIEVMAHHGHTFSDDREWDEQATLILESWQAPIVVTTFNQLFRGLFPTKAQESMRLAALNKAVILIDEPQIIDLSVWRPFLAMLDAAMRHYELSVIFITATPPPFVPGLSEQPISLVRSDMTFPSRYELRQIQEPLEETMLAREIIENSESSNQVALIMNTIADASIMLRELSDTWDRRKKNVADKPKIINLHGAMTALHKRILIEQLKAALMHRERIWAVTTQIIEAGVDVSFEVLYRALPVFPSIIQAAGRVNRHGNQIAPGRIVVFPFRSNEKDTRLWIYRDQIAREETDRLLKFFSDGEATETEIYPSINNYYKRVMLRTGTDAQNTAFQEARVGRWDSVAGWGPFGDERPTVPVFISWGEEFLNEFSGEDELDESIYMVEDASLRNELIIQRELLQVRKLLHQFGIEKIEHLYERYRERGWLSSLDFVTRKRFIALLDMFTVPLPPKLAMQVSANYRDDVSIKLAADRMQYSDISGFGTLYTDVPEAVII